MAHIDEDRFRAEYVLPWLQTQFPRASYETERWVDGSDGFVDVWVELGAGETPGVILACEVGNDETVRDECAQAVEYAAAHTRAIPYVFIPATHSSANVVETFRDRGLVVVEIPVEQTGPQ